MLFEDFLENAGLSKIDGHIYGVRIDIGTRPKRNDTSRLSKSRWRTCIQILGLMFQMKYTKQFS